MTQEIYLLSDLDSLLSKDNIKEDDLPHFPELSLETVPKNSPDKTPVIHESEKLPITPTHKPTIGLNYKPGKRRSTIFPKQLFQGQKQNEEAASKYNFTKNPQNQV